MFLNFHSRETIILKKNISTDIITIISTTVSYVNIVSSGLE